MLLPLRPQRSLQSAAAAREVAEYMLAKRMTPGDFEAGAYLREPGTGFLAAHADMTLADAYAVHAAMEELAPHGGYKVGATNAAAQKGFGVEEPFCAPLPAAAIRSAAPAGAAGAALTIPAAELGGGEGLRGGEAEWCFKLKPEGDAAWDALLAAAARDDVDAAAIVGVVNDLFPAVEVCATRYGTIPGPPSAPMKILDGGGNGAVVKATALPGPDAALPLAERLASFADRAVVARVDGEVKAEGSGRDVLGDPLNALAWLANELRGSPGRLGALAGRIVMTGTCVGLVRVLPGQTFAADFEGYGVIEVDFPGA